MAKCEIGESFLNDSSADFYAFLKTTDEKQKKFFFSYHYYSSYTTCFPSFWKKWVKLCIKSSFLKVSPEHSCYGRDEKKHKNRAKRKQWVKKSTFVFFRMRGEGHRLSLPPLWRWSWNIMHVQKNINRYNQNYFILISSTYVWLTRLTSRLRSWDCKAHNYDQ